MAVNGSRVRVKIWWKDRGLLVDELCGRGAFSTRRDFRRAFRRNLSAETYRKPNRLSAGTDRRMDRKGTADLGEMLPEGRFGFDRGFHAFAGVNHRAVVAATEELGDGE